MNADPVQAVAEALHAECLWIDADLAASLAESAVAAAEPHLTREAKAAALRTSAERIHRAQAAHDRIYDENRVLAARLAAVEALAYQSDDGTEYDHNGHGPHEGEPECPGCWADSLRAALATGTNQEADQ